MNAYDLDAEQQHLGTKLRFLFCDFEGRTLDDACLAEMAKTLTQELASELDGRHIRLLREHSGIRVEVAHPLIAGETTNVGFSARPAEGELAGLEAVRAALAA